MSKDIEEVFGVRSCAILEDMNREELEALREGAKLREYDEKNPILCEEGTTGDGFGLVVSGQVRVFKSDTKGKEYLLAVLKEGDFFGEMALIDEEVRSASCHALEDVTVLWINHGQFKKLQETHQDLVSKLLIKLMVNLSHRLRLLNDRYVYVRSCYTGKAA